MLPPSMMIDWARCLLAYEAVVGEIPSQPQAATFLVYEKLRGQLSAPMGTEGFRAYASRALMLAESDAPGLGALQIAVDGELQGLGEVKPQTDPNHGGEIGLIFIAQLLGLFLTFLGKETTRRLVHDVFPYLEIAKESGTATEPDTSIPFEKILAEVEQLRSICERLEILADVHPALEEGLIMIAGNIRNLTAVLNVLVVMRSQPDKAGVTVPTQSLTGYVN
jgi:hypothetical protein